jgi:hypothetical protein
MESFTEVGLAQDAGFGRDRGAFISHGLPYADGFWVAPAVIFSEPITDWPNLLTAVRSFVPVIHQRKRSPESHACRHFIT